MQNEILPHRLPLGVDGMFLLLCKAVSSILDLYGFDAGVFLFLLSGTSNVPFLYEKAQRKTAMQ